VNWEPKLFLSAIVVMLLCLAVVAFTRSERSGPRPVVGTVLILLCIGLIIGIGALS